MPKIKMEKQTNLPPQELFKKIQGFLSDDRDLRKLDSNYKCQFDENNLSGTAKGSKFEAHMKVASAAGGSNVQIEISIPLMLTPFKGFVEKTVQSKLDSLVG